ncbi:MAG: histidine kinase dimerization/phosphoacceptor domain -containing protein [Bacteroidota bacterium]
MGVFIGVIALTSAVMVVFLPSHLEKSYSSQALRAVGDVADMAASGVAPALAQRDTAACAGVLRPFLQNRDLLFAIVLDDSGRTFYSSAKENPGAVPAGSFLSAQAPVQGPTGRSGVVIVGSSSGPMETAVGEMKVTVAIAAGLFLVIGTLFCVTFALRVTKSLHKLVESLGMGTAEEDTGLAAVASDDEMGIFVSRYNEVVGEVRSLRAEIRRTREGMEHRVAERTAILEKEVEEGKRSTDLLKTSLQEKEVLLREIHHRVKNNLQVISSMLNLQSHTIADPAVREILRVSQGRVRSMATIHEMLYRTDDLARIDFSGYVRTLAAQLFRSYSVNPNLVLLELNIHPMPFSIDSAIPCGLIINELISNALKYAFPDGRRGTIRVNLEPCPRTETSSSSSPASPATVDSVPRICLTVSDDGIGLPLNINPASSATLGLMLVSTLTDQLSGKLTLSRENGTTFHISFIGSTKNPDGIDATSRTPRNSTPSPVLASSTNMIAATHLPGWPACRP